MGLRRIALELQRLDSAFNLFVTISNQLSRPTGRFADSTADITEVLG